MRVFSTATATSLLEEEVARIADNFRARMVSKGPLDALAVGILENAVRKAVEPGEDGTPFGSLSNPKLRIRLRSWSPGLPGCTLLRPRPTAPPEPIPGWTGELRDFGAREGSVAPQGPARDCRALGSVQGGAGHRRRRGTEMPTLRKPRPSSRDQSHDHHNAQPESQQDAGRRLRHDRRIEGHLKGPLATMHAPVEGV